MTVAARKPVRGISAPAHLARLRLRAWAVAAVERGRTAWPEIVVSEDELVRIAAIRLAEAATPGADQSHDQLDAAELYLAVACARGDAAAVRQLRARYFDTIAGQLRRMGVDDATRDDVWQTLCERLLVATDDAPARIARYAGTGELAGLIRTAATRLALNWLDREKRRCSAGDWLDVLPDTRSDPELHLLKHRSCAELEEELAGALGVLAARDRSILRLHLVERLGIDRIAGVHVVHRATAARWVARAKQTLARLVRDRLVARWRLADGSLPALVSLVDIELDFSLERLLAGD
jgi:RNA polymerase sigma-70 factor (ECF subfamily)